MLEPELIAWLRERLPRHPALRVAPGDDAAVLGWRTAGDAVLSTDMLADGVHFHVASCGPEAAGYKALAVNLSDLAAMAAEPQAALVSVLLPRGDGLESAKRLYEGMLPAAERFGVAIAGGDTNVWTGPLVVNVAVVGRATDRGPLCRNGAQPGDAVVVTGRFGGSLLGRHLTFTPRVREALHLHRNYRLHAGMDVSDGLAIDVSRLARESGCGVELLSAAIPISEAAYQLARESADGRSALQHALSDGEDFELVLAMPESEAARLVDDAPLEVPLTRIGRVVSEPGLWQIGDDGKRRPLAPSGYQHG